MHRSRPDPLAATMRLEAVVPARLPGGWIPPPFAEDQSWAPRPTEQAPTVEQPADLLGWGGLLSRFVPEGLRSCNWDPARRCLPVLAAIAGMAALAAGFISLR